MKAAWQFINIGRFGLAALVVLFCAARGAAAADTLTFSQAQPGNIFTSGQSVQIPVHTTGDEVTWTATDYFGVPTSGGPVAVNAQGDATILPNLNRLGYFGLRVTALRGGSAVSAADTAFAVVAPVSVGAMSDSPFGAVTHFGQGWDPAVMPLMALGGIAQLRDEQEWNAVEPTPGNFTYSNLFTAYMSNAAAWGLNPLMELDFENPNYDGGLSPYTQDGNNAFANYGIQLLNRYNPQIKTVEVWNEYNGSYFKGSVNANRPQLYAAMLQTTYQAVQAYNAAHPGQQAVRVIGGACVPISLPWFSSLFDYGALAYMDAAAVHPYRAIPEGVENELADLQSLMARHGGIKPIWATECGYADTINPGRQLMAAYLVRLMTLMRSAGVERAYWYLLYDEPGYSTGLLRSPSDPLGPYAPTAGYSAFANMVQQLYGATYVRRENTDLRTRFYLFNRGANHTEVRVLWSTVSTAQLEVSASGPLTLVNIMGESTVKQPVNGKVSVTADSNPVYLIGPVTAVRETGRDTLLADSVNDFSSSQGTARGPGYYGAWSYGSYVVTASSYDSAGFAASIYDPAGFTSMAWTPTSNNWTAPYYAARIDTDGAHPSARPVDLNNPSGAYTQVWVVRRWRSNVAGSVHIRGQRDSQLTGGRRLRRQNLRGRQSDL